MSKSLFEDFDAVSAKAWKQKIQFDLKGADYNDTLIWHSDEGIAVKPFYHSDDFDESPEISKTKATDWKISQFVKVTDANAANIKAIDAINRGAESIYFQIESQAISIEDLFRNIDLNKTLIVVRCEFLSEEYTKKIDKKLKNSTTSGTQPNHCVQTDIIGNLAKSGNWFSNLKSDHSKFVSIIENTNQFSVDMELYQNAGATMAQQLAYGLAHANEYLNYLNKILKDDKKQSLKVIFKTSVGSNYFFEIAKLRALRQLWALLASEYNCHKDCEIIVSPSRRNKTIYDYNVNLLRTTTECMSAVLGGANIVCNMPYDALYHKTNEFGERISRNQLLVLKHESYFNKVNNPADGSYYIESLTSQLAEKALDIFKSIEAGKGFLRQLKEGTVQRKIKENAAKEQADFDAQELVLLGTNKYPNASDRMKNELEIDPFLTKNKRKTLIEPIIQKRWSEKLEIKRLRQEKINYRQNL